jgi:competence protein ComEA
MIRTSIGLVVAAFLLASPMAHAASVSQDAAEAKTSAASVNLNTASAAQLEELPGIGAKMALRIVEYRQKNGGFKKIEDLMNVKGIGEKAFLKLKPHLTVSPPKA